MMRWKELLEKKPHAWVKWAVIAACLCIVLAGFFVIRQRAAALPVEQVENPVRWEQTVRAMIADGVDTFVECGAGKTLSGLIARIDGNVKVCRAEDDATLADALAKIGGEA